MATNATVPPAPPLSGEAVLDVFVHHLVPSQIREPFGDGNRLALLGKRTLVAAYTAAISRARRDLRGDSLQLHIDVHFDAFVTHWVDAYGWRGRMISVPSGIDLTSAGETRRIFETYVGAVLTEGKYDVFNWIDQLVKISG